MSLARRRHGWFPTSMKIYQVRNQDTVHYVTSQRAAKLMEQRNLGQVKEIEFDLTKVGITEMLNALGLEEPVPEEAADLDVREVREQFPDSILLELSNPPSWEKDGDYGYFGPV